MQVLLYDIMVNCLLICFFGALRIWIVVWWWGIIEGRAHSKKEGPTLKILEFSSLRFTREGNDASLFILTLRDGRIL